jgi:hypothetical protein
VVFQIFEYHVTNYARCSREIEYKIVVEKAAFNKKTFHHKMKDETILKYYIWKIALCGAGL